MLYDRIDEFTGNTPLAALHRIEAETGAKAKLYAKLEYMNPAGSAKDRAALQMIEDAEQSGQLDRDTVIIEATSGNTGIGLAAIGAARGYRVVIIMPDTMSKERILTMEAYGAEVVLSDGAKGMTGSLEMLESVKATYPKHFVAGQFENPSNAKAHYLTTGPEIVKDLGGQIDIFVAGVGTGGTLTGTGRYLKEKVPGVRIIAVEPENSAVLSGGQPGKHDLQGIGGGFIPAVLDQSLIDGIETVSDAEAYAYGRMLAAKEGYLVGITSGAALAAAVRLSLRPENEGKRIVVFCPDTGLRYLSSRMFDDSGDRS